MPDAVAQFLRYLDHERGASPHTLRGYAADLAELRSFLGRQGVTELASAVPLPGRLRTTESSPPLAAN